MTEAGLVDPFLVFLELLVRNESLNIVSILFRVQVHSEMPQNPNPRTAMKGIVHVKSEILNLFTLRPF